MSASVLLARRNLTRNRVRLVASVGGVALVLASSLLMALLAALLPARSVARLEPAEVFRG